MDPQIQGSFIPKQPLTTSGRSRAGLGLFLLVAIIIFVLSVVGAGGAFGYKVLLEKALVERDNSLRLAEGAFEPGAVQDLVRMDNRLTQANTLLQKHVSPSALFLLLSEITLERVQFKEFSYTLLPDGSATLALSGSADSFSGVALQSDEFGKNRSLRDVIFSGITVQESGRVNFSVAATVDQSLLLYHRSLQASATQ